MSGKNPKPEPANDAADQLRDELLEEDGMEAMLREREQHKIKKIIHRKKKSWGHGAP